MAKEWTLRLTACHKCMKQYKDARGGAAVKCECGSPLPVPVVSCLGCFDMSTDTRRMCRLCDGKGYRTVEAIG